MSASHALDDVEEDLLRDGGRGRSPNALAARDAGLAEPARDALDAGLAAALLAGFAAFEAGLA